MSEFPFPPERLWTQYEGGAGSGPPPPKPVGGDFMIFGAQLQTVPPSLPPSPFPPRCRPSPLPRLACRSPAPPRPAQSKPKGLLESSKIPRHFESDSPSKLGAELTKLNAKLMQTFLAVLDEMLTNPTVGGLDAAGQPLGDWVPVAAGQSLEKLKVGAPPP